MSKHIRCAMAMFCLTMLCGCSIAGSWKTVRIDPEDKADSFAFSSVDFDTDGKYSAVVKYGGKSRTTSGKYEWNGFNLKIMPRDGDARDYRGEMWWGKTLKLHHKADGESMTGVLERMAE